MQRPDIHHATAYAIYRTPHSTHYTILLQHTAPQAYARMADVPLCGGYVVAPFAADAQCPVVLIKPDECFTRPIDGEEVRHHTLEAAVEGEEAERAAYGAAFRTVSEALQRGEAEKVVLSRRRHLRLEREADPFMLFLLACRYRPGGFVALWHTPQSGTWLVATPEPLLEATHTAWHTVALAGTLPNDAPASAWNAKNREEQAIVARFIARCLGDAATDVQRSPTYTLQSGNIQHLCTDFTFQMPDAGDIGHLIERLHPTPAVSGLPRERANALILANESTPRHYYAGFSGPLMLGGTTALYVSLRCMHLDRLRATLYAGGGIMPDSVEAEEWEETNRKLMTMMQLV